MGLFGFSGCEVGFGIVSLITSMVAESEIVSYKKDFDVACKGL